MARDRTSGASPRQASDRVGALTDADRALLQMLRTETEVSSRFWDSLRTPWGERLEAAWEATRSEADGDARRELVAELQAQARPDLARIHVSWFLRALKDETPAVQRAVISHAPSRLREGLRLGLGLEDEELLPDHSPHPEALRWVLSLWTERLVGDRSERPDDPAPIVALTSLRPAEACRLVRAIGLAKWSLASAEPPNLRARERNRIDHFITRFHDAGASLRDLACRDFDSFDRSRRHPLERFGMLTLARLLEGAEPYRVRWALQHIPYSSAKFTRSLMASKRLRDPDALGAEAQILHAAWDRLVEEGRIALSRGGGA